MDFEKDYLDEKESLDVEEDFEKPELTKGAIRDTDPQYFTNIDGIYAKDAAGRAAVEELRTLVTGYSETVLYEATTYQTESGNSNVINTITLSQSINNFDVIRVSVWMTADATSHEKLMSMEIPVTDAYVKAVTSDTDFADCPYCLNCNGESSGAGYTRRIEFGFTNSTTLKTISERTFSDDCSFVYKVVGIKYGGSTGSVANPVRSLAKFEQEEPFEKEKPSVEEISR